MEGRFTGAGVFRWLVMAVVALAGAAAVAMVLSRNTTAGSQSEASSPDGDGVESADTPPATRAPTRGATTMDTSTTSVPASPVPANEAAGSEVSPFERDNIFRWLWVDPEDLRFLWRDEAGRPYGQLQAARVALEDRGEQVLAITNGGIHRPDLVPSGLYIEDGVELRPLNRGRGSGNFFLQPNGVFWVGDGAAGIDTTGIYDAAARGSTVDAAVQSGPMLVIDSEINPVFSESSTSTHRRNAVGVDAEGRVLLIMADRAVTLWAMADRCRELGAVDALYLDGTLSRLEHAADGRSIFPNLPVASMIAVVEGRGASG